MRVTFEDADAVAAVPASTPSRVAAAAPNDISFLRFIYYPLVRSPDLVGPDVVDPNGLWGTYRRKAGRPVGSAPNPTIWQRSRGTGPSECQAPFVLT